MPPATTVSSITLVVATGAASGVTHGWYALLDSSMIVRAVSADQTGGNWGITGSAATLTMTSPYITPAGGAYYIGWCVVAGTTPSFYRQAGAQAAVFGLAPVLSGSSTNGLTTPPAVGATMAALTAGGFPVYGYIS